MRTYKLPFSIFPIEELGKIEKTKALSKEMALLWFGIGLAGGIGLLSVEVLLRIEPLQVNNLSQQPFVVFLYFIVLLVISLFGYKQWGYYFRESGIGKEGIFVQTIGIVNRLEETTDICLSFLDGLLLACCRLPIVWFIMLSIYTLTVLFRSLITLMRPKFSKEKNFPPQYCSALKMSHNGFWVPAVLWGWVILHGTVALFAVVIAIIFFSTAGILSIQVGVILRIIAILVLMLMLSFLPNVSYRIGLKIVSESK